MKIFSLCLFLICFNLNAQNLIVKYKFKFSPLKEEYNSQLSINGSESKYEIFEKNNLVDSLPFQNESNDQNIILKNKIFFNRVIFKKISSGIQNVEFLKPNFSKNNELLKIIDNEQVTWNITIESRMILNYSCTKATGTYKNKSYEAWFCPQLKYSDGPWKFRGLPGLILNIESIDNQLKIDAFEISQTQEDISKDRIEVAKSYTWPEYVEYCNNYLIKLKSSLMASNQDLDNLKTEIDVSVIDPDFRIDLK
ncbi:MAG: GLPGLI family protein [Cytophagales bacterium]|nr:GLPGLI family protein [Cytophagales bacterium]